MAKTVDRAKSNYQGSKGLQGDQKGLHGDYKGAKGLHGDQKGLQGGLRGSKGQAP